MFKSFDDKEFQDALDKKDYSKLKSFLICAIRNNPGFEIEDHEEYSETKQIVFILNERCPNIFEDYHLQPSENKKDLNDKNKWNYDFFLQETFFLGENFSIERFNQLLIIGQAIDRRKTGKRKETPFVIKQNNSEREATVRLNKASEEVIKDINSEITIVAEKTVAEEPVVEEIVVEETAVLEPIKEEFVAEQQAEKVEEVSADEKEEVISNDTTEDDIEEVELEEKTALLQEEEYFVENISRRFAKAKDGITSEEAVSKVVSYDNLKQLSKSPRKENKEW